MYRNNINLPAERKNHRWNPNKIVLWVVVALAVIYEALVTWFYFPHMIAIGIYIIEPLVIWGSIEFIKYNGKDTRTLVAIMILEPLFVVAIPYGIYTSLIIPLLKMI